MINEKLNLLGISNSYYVDNFFLVRIRNLIHLCIFKNANLDNLLIRINKSSIINKIYNVYPFKKLSIKI